ncbi:MAG: hypothetical protein WCP28_01295 [Actinomycetes bacterium]
MRWLELALHWALFAVGLVLFATTLAGLVTSMLIPRPKRARLALFANHLARVALRFFAWRQESYEARDAILAASGPTAVLVQLVVFLLGFWVAFSCMIFGVSDLGTADSMYQSGATLLTLGIVEPVNTAQVIITFVAAALGLVVIAILIGYLLTLYAAFTPRESHVNKLSLLAGEPAWGPELICRDQLLLGGEAASFDVEEWVDWASDVRMAHTVNPILNHFRSPGPRRSWVISMLAVLDAANLRLTTVSGNEMNPAMVRLVTEGTETLAAVQGIQTMIGGAAWVPVRTSRGRLAHGELAAATAGQNAVVAAIAADARNSGRHLIQDPTAKYHAEVGITREEWDHACAVMERAGVVIFDDRDQAWRDFSAVRITYASNAYAIADSVYAVRAPWSGTRNPDTDTIWPTLAVDGLSDDAAPASA